MRTAAIALGLAGLAAAGTALAAIRSPSTATAHAGWVTDSSECSPGQSAGEAVERRSKITVNGEVPDYPSPLRPGARIETSSRGKGLICLKQGRWECDVDPSTVVRVLPRESVVVELKEGRVTCSTPARFEQRIKAPGSRLFLGGRIRLPAAAEGADAAAGGQVFSIGFRDGRTIVKIRRGAGVLASKRTLRAVVLGRGEQAAVPLGRDPLRPTSITLTDAERAIFAERERSLPKETDRTAPTVTVLGPRDPSSLRSARFTFIADEGAVFSCALDGTDLRLCTSPFDIQRAAPGRHTFLVRATDAAGYARIARFSWTVDASRIAFESFRDGNPEIYAVDPDGENVARLTTNAISDEHPDWSPGQRQIAFDRLGDDRNLDIYVMNADGSGQTRLTEDSALDRNPAWSPDGARIAFESYRDGNREIYLMNADGSGEHRLTTDPAEDLDPAWSPDSTRLVFASTRDGNYEIYAMNADGSGQTRLTNHPGDDFGPSWSPRRDRIAFHSLQTGDYKNIFAMNPDGSGVAPVTRTERNDTNPSWAPDAAHIVFQSDRDSSSEEQLYIVDLETGVTGRVPMGSTRANFVPDW
jgi:Tol biopolymer transport system component